jgi:transposase
MYIIREILRLKFMLGRSHREVARSLGISAGKVGQTVIRARERGLDWEGVQQLSDEALELRLHGPKSTGRNRPLPDPAVIHTELRRPGVTLELLHLEYLQEHPHDGYRYTTFCDHYRQWRDRQSPVMRQVHKAGDKAFVDYSGKKPRLVDRHTGEVREVELFVGVLGASHYVYAEATETQKVGDWVHSHVRMLDFFGGVPRALVPDQLRSGVRSPDRYEPLAQRSYAEMARHYQTAIVPARPGKPRDKAKVESAVLLVQRWILARLRNETFFSLRDLNARIAELLEELNERPMKKLGGVSRRQLFVELEQKALGPLPADRFVLGHWKKARVNIDYHVEYERHYYSVPYSLLKEEVEIRATAMSVEVLHRGQRVACHRRSTRVGQHSTIDAHMPKSHRAHASWSPSRLVNWARSIGPQTGALVSAILNDRPHPEMGYRSCLGILRLSKRYGPERLEAACTRALRVGARSYRHVDSILKHGLDRVEVDEVATHSCRPDHGNIRGPGYYH